ncbi:hypothetical protein [Pseudomonas sp. PIC25]|uniref:hypothetical protein n=1 Tax=Pseudomonas sp. PIC25 TaxID=1958773 RepID=UPI00117B8823|nr:hypothetical protein [Pseudomonas sp. PIC25]
MLDLLTQVKHLSGRRPDKQLEVFNENANRRQAAKAWPTPARRCSAPGWPESPVGTIADTGVIKVRLGLFE